MLNTKSRAAACAVLLLACLGFQACDSSTILTTLTTIVDGASAAVGIITALNGAGVLPNNEAEGVLNYLEATTKAANSSINEWESKDKTDTKITKIAQDFGKVAALKLTGIQNKEVEASIQAVSASIQSFLAQLKGNSVRAHVYGISTEAIRHDFKTNYQLHKIKAKAEKTQQQIADWRTGQIAANALKNPKSEDR